MSQITTHILDTSTGKPAAGVYLILQEFAGMEWEKIAEGTTDDNGRVSNLLSPDIRLDSGIYRLMFETKAYFNKHNLNSFYPFVTIEFEITDASHYHIPLLLSPFGYSTYRGS